MFWLLFFVVMLLGVIGGLWYVVRGICRFEFIKKLEEKNKKRTRFAVAAGLVCICALFVFVMGMMNMMVIMVNLMVVWMLADLIAFIVKKINGKTPGRYYAGAAALTFTVLYLCYGWYCGHHVWVTEYNLENHGKRTGELTVVQITDSHIGVTFDGKGMAKYVKKINDLHPDVVVITGDFVDDDTNLKDMEEACKALKNLKTKYGVYYCYGNHDRGVGGQKWHGDLEKNLIKAGVVILQDRSVTIDNRLVIVGREDASRKSRSSVADLMAQVDTSKYVLVLDHQPKEYDEERAAGADLVLSGHTHGGQMIPVNKFGEWAGVNEMTYGLKSLADIDYVVSSGISSWAIAFKTGCHSELTVFHIR